MNVRPTLSGFDQGFNFNLPIEFGSLASEFSQSFATRIYHMCFAFIPGLKEAVRTDKAPAALGPYSQAIKTDNLLFVSGVLGLIPETGKFVSECVEDQTEQVTYY
ncbi:reactive Intermediate Deaminase A, chloroplastic-like [Camellia sinensis]|uniref:reactive Intermediate Deaminase A, chloroplastic-like n=1 Tax=Camellia sinensis TaxID=4442 RepID=UPI001036DF73|nr:reactive Intermediate Deaminase A, chloroplastic-like [Camellia sinensis]